MAVALVCAGAGSALLTSTAMAGGTDDRGRLSAAVYNYTPYTWTLVTAQQSAPCPYNDPTGQNRCWAQPPPQTIAPGATPVYQLDPNLLTGGIFGHEYGYDAYFTYRVDVVGGAPEYVTIGISQCDCGGIYGSSIASVLEWDTVAPPPAGWKASTLAPPGPQTANAQLVARPGPQLYDVTLTAVGNFTADGSTENGQAFADLLNSACSGADNTSCSFTQTKPITYSPGPLTVGQEVGSCDLTPSGGGTPGGGGQPVGPGEKPADNDPNYHTIEYEAAQSASLSVGGGVTATTKFSLFNTISAEASVSVEAEHEWEETKSETRDAKVYLRGNAVAFIWVAPTIGRLTGTIVATVGSATYTVTNFTETRSGVTGQGDPQKDPTPAYNVVTTTRPMNATELKDFCGESSSAQLQALKAKPPSSLVPGRSIAHVALGDPQEVVLRRLGWPTEQRFPLKPCAGLRGCTAVRGFGGTWNYRKRRLSVVFDAHRRVVALNHSGPLGTATGVGRDSTLASLRGTFPRIACQKFVHHVDCSLKRVSARQTVRTVFRLTDRGDGGWKTKRVLIYVDGRGQVKS